MNKLNTTTMNMTNGTETNTECRISISELATILEKVYGNEDDILSGTESFISSLPAQGSKRPLAPLIYAVEKWLAADTGNENIQVIDVCTGGGSLAVNGYFKNCIANDIDYPLICLHKEIKSGNLTCILQEAFDIYARAKDYFCTVTNSTCETKKGISQFAKWFYDAVVGKYYEPMTVVKPKPEFEFSIPPYVVGLFAVYCSVMSGRLSGAKQDTLEFIDALKAIITLLAESNDPVNDLYKHLKKLRSNGRFKALFRYAYHLMLSNIEFTSDDALEILGNLKDTGKECLLLVDMPYPSDCNNYHVDGQFQYWDGVYEFLQALLGTDARFILFADENCIDVFGGLKDFDGINFYRTEFRRHNDGVKEYIITNFKLPEANYDTFTDDFKKLTKIIFNSRKRSWGYTDDDFDKEKRYCLPYTKMEKVPCRNTGRSGLMEYINRHNG